MYFFQILKARLTLPPYLTNEARGLLKKVNIVWFAFRPVNMWWEIRCKGLQLCILNGMIRSRIAAVAYLTVLRTSVVKFRKRRISAYPNEIPWTNQIKIGTINYITAVKLYVVYDEDQLRGSCFSLLVNWSSSMNFPQYFVSSTCTANVMPLVPTCHMPIHAVLN